MAYTNSVGGNRARLSAAGAKHRRGVSAAGSPTGFEPSNPGPRHPRRPSQLCLTPTPALTRLPNGTTELKRQPRGVVRFSGTRLSQPPLPRRDQPPPTRMT